MKGFWIAGWVFGSMMVLSAFSTGCGLSECTDDPTTAEDECAEVYILPGEDGEPETREEGGESSAEEEFGCELDGMCNFLCVDVEGTPQDPDCNPNVPGKGESAQQNPSCDCDYWGFVCEAASQCSSTACDCDPDCAHPTETIEPCGADLHCDTWCPTGTDWDCANLSEDGKYCAAPGDESGGEPEPEEPESMNEEGGDERTDSCDESVGFCDAVEGTVEACPVDPDCDGILFFPCEGDGYCDGKCADGSDPDCE